MSGDNLAFVTALYRNVLGREPDAQGLAGWVAAADNGSVDTISLSRAFITSPEAVAVVNPVYRLYDALFNRLAEAGGLSGWAGALRNGASIKGVVDQFLASPEFSARLGDGFTNETLIDALYANVLNRTADEIGRKSWLDGLNSGQFSRADVVLGITFSPEALDGGSAATGQLTVAQAFEAMRGRLPSQAELSARLGASFDALLGALATQALSGKVADGYIKDATVFIDLDGDGKLGPGEESTTTDAQGNFSLPAGASGKLVVTGGTDISTNKPFTGRFEAPAGSTVVNPLTTLMQKLVEKGQSVEQAQATVVAKLGLPSDLSLTSYDPLNAASSATKGSADAALAVQVQSVAAQMANLFAMAGGALSGAGAQAGNTLTGDAAASAVADGLAQSLLSSGAGALNLSSATVLSGIIASAAAAASLPAAAQTAVTQASAATATLVAASNASVASAASQATLDPGAIMTMMAKVQVVAQGELANKIATSLESGGSPTALLTAYTGTNLASAVNVAEIGSVVQGYTPPADLPNIPAVTVEAPPGILVPPATGTSGGGGSGPPSPTFTVFQNADGTVSFGGTATGNIALRSFDDDTLKNPGNGTGQLKASRGGIETTLTITDSANPFTGFTLASGQTFYVLYDEADGMPISGVAGSKVNLISEPAPDPDDAVVWDDTRPYDYRAITAPATLVFRSVDGDVTVASGVMLGTLHVYVESGASVTLPAAQADARILSGPGDVTVTGVTATSNLRGISSTGEIILPIEADLDLSGHIINLRATEIQVSAGKTLTMTAAQADSRGAPDFTGAGNLIVTGSPGAQVLKVETTGTNLITPGLGLDTVTLYQGADTVGIALGQAPLARRDVVTLSGGYQTGDQVRITVDGHDVSYTVVANDMTVNGDGSGGAASETQILNNLRTKLASALNGDASVLQVVTAAADSADGAFTVTANTPGVSFTMSNWVETQSGTGRVNSQMTTANRVATVSESAPGYGGVAHSIDEITGFTVGQDRLDLSGGTGVLADSTYAFIDGAFVTVSHGVVTATNVTTGDELIGRLLWALGSSTRSVAFNSGSNSYVIQGDGTAGGAISDIVVKLTGTTVSDLSGVLV